MNIPGMLGKLQDLKKSMDEIKSRLDSVSVEGASGDKNVNVRMTANRKVTHISIDESLLNPSRKGELEELLVVACNQAIESANKVSEAEMSAAGKGLLPGIPGLF